MSKAKSSHPGLRIDVFPYGDWEAIYVNGKLIHFHDRLDTYDLLHKLNDQTKSGWELHYNADLNNESGGNDSLVCQNLSSTLDLIKQKKIEAAQKEILEYRKQIETLSNKISEIEKE